MDPVVACGVDESTPNADCLCFQAKVYVNIVLHASGYYSYYQEFKNSTQTKE
jgi:hypothetical protein